MPKTERTFRITNRRYLGSKTKLLSFIHETIDKENIIFDSFLDLFAGTGSVAESFNDGQHKIIVNDILECNRCSYNAFFGNQKINEKKLFQLISELNNLSGSSENYFSDNFSRSLLTSLPC